MNKTGGAIQNGHGGTVTKSVATSPVSPSRSIYASEDDITTRTLRFLSTASTETIIAIAVGLAASTYMVLGRVGLILIGALGGIVLHATWESQNAGALTPEDARKEKGIDIIKRLLDLKDIKAEDDDDAGSDNAGESAFEGLRPETGAALNDLVDAVIRDYIKWWYSPLVPKDQTFPTAVRQTLVKLIVAISSHLSRKRPADTFLDFLTNSSSIVIVFLNELSSALSLPQSRQTPITPTEAVYEYLARNPESNLANVLNTKQHAKKFKMIAEDILENFLDKQAYDCDAARVFLREILAGVVLEMTLQTCCKPEWINGWIVYLLEEGEPDISQVIDAGIESSTGFSSSSYDAFDGNIGSMEVTKPSKSQVAKQEEKRHKKRLSKAEEAMEEAMEEAQRISRLIAEEDAKKLQPQTPEMPSTEPLKSVLAAVGQVPPPSTPIKKERNGALTTQQTPQTVDGKESGALSSNSTPQASLLPADNFVNGSSNTTTANSVTASDQTAPKLTPQALQQRPSSARRTTLSLTLHNANIIIHDDSTPSDKGKIRTKPTSDYLVQIEPSSSVFPGWMIVRRYADFETLHEVLRRIAQVSGVAAFSEQHQALPSWKTHTKASLRGELERYVRDACWYQPLAESEGMKRFLEKDQGQAAYASQKTGFPGLGWSAPAAFESMGKGMLDVITNAPKGVAEGGKAIGGGISGVFTNIGNLGQKKPISTPTGVSMHPAGRASTSVLPRMDSSSSINGARKARASEDSLRATPITQQPPKIPPMERRPSYNSIIDEEADRETRHSSARSSLSGRRSATHSRDPSRAPSSRRGTPISSPLQSTIDEIRLPPPPNEMPDDYSTSDDPSTSTAPTARTSTSTAPSQHSPGRPSLSIPRRPSVPILQTQLRKPRKESPPLSEAETRVAVELLFAVINELYTLSSAWNIRRTLLTAAKTFLLRPGNPSLSSIQSLIQDSVIASNTSDAGIAAHLNTLRKNVMPTEEEKKAWPPEKTPEENERLRIKARKLLIERGVPDALSGVMGQSTTGEALGKVFDCLQVEEVARGLVFGLLLQAVRAVTH